MSRPRASIFTSAVHSGFMPVPAGKPAAPPLLPSAGWEHDSMEALDAALADERSGYAYARNAGPTPAAFENAMAEVEGGEAAVAFASGMAALHAAVLAAGAAPGASIVAAQEVYGATRTLLTHLAAQTGLQVRYVRIRDLDTVQATLAGSRAAALVFEILTNPLAWVADLPALGHIARAAGARVIVDSTFTSPYLIRPLEYGADIVFHSATKFIGGHGDVLAGVAIAAEEPCAAMRATRRLLGANLSPFDAWLALRGLRTLPLRMREQCRNALTLAQYLSDHPRVAAVHYPGLPDHPDHALVRRLFGGRGFGAIVAFDLAEAGRAEAFAFLERLRVIRRIASLGDVATLASYPAHASHRGLSPQDRAALGIGDGQIRLSVGIEDAQDLIADLAQALDG